MTGPLRGALTSALSLALVGGTWAIASQVGAAPPEANPDAMNVYGAKSTQLVAALKYWNRHADEDVLHYAGAAPTAPDAHTVTVKIDWLETMAGAAQGNVGSTPIAITVDSRRMLDWQVYAHELGHALGFDDYNTGLGYGTNDASYTGVMSYATQLQPNPKADQKLLANR